MECNKVEIETHPFDSFIPQKISVLLIGSFPGKEQTQNKCNLKETDEWFYGAKRNQFWKIISSVYDVELKTKQDKKTTFDSWPAPCQYFERSI